MVTTLPKLRAPFPWFGGKMRAAELIWSRLGRVKNYVEPFAGSLAVLLGAPEIPPVETANDVDGYITNFWRAVKINPGLVAHFTDWPINENDLHARHMWLVRQKTSLVPRLEGDPEYYDARIAGYWVWGLNCWIGHGWCSGRGPWQSTKNQLFPELVKTSGPGVYRKKPTLSHLRGLFRKKVRIKKVGLNDGKAQWRFETLARRLAKVRICCGDWSRVVTHSVTTELGLTGVLLDPPYDTQVRQPNLYNEDADGLMASVVRWAIDHGDDPQLRIALCMYDRDQPMPAGWTSAAWKANGGYGSQNKNGRAYKNASRETVWFSPHCATPLPRIGITTRGQ